MNLLFTSVLKTTCILLGGRTQIPQSQCLGDGEMAVVDGFNEETKADELAEKERIQQRMNDFLSETDKDL